MGTQHLRFVVWRMDGVAGASEFYIPEGSSLVYSLNLGYQLDSPFKLSLPHGFFAPVEETSFDSELLSEELLPAIDLLCAPDLLRQLHNLVASVTISDRPCCVGCAFDGGFGLRQVSLPKIVLLCCFFRL